MVNGQQIQGPPNPQQPLSYTGGSPNEVVFNRRPTPTDNNPYLIGCRWTIPISLSFPTGEFWVLVSLVNGLATWKKLQGNIETAETLTGNTGGPVGPDANQNINVVGTGNVLVTGTPLNNTLTISRTGGGGGFVGLINKIYITATGAGTYTPTGSPTAMLQCYVECVGGGGGSGSGNAGGSVAYDGAAAGGYCAKLFTAAQIGASQSYSVASGGAGGTSGGNGGNGGNTTFGSFLTANGGQGALVSTSGPIRTVAVGGSATGGDINITGGYGSHGVGALEIGEPFYIGGGGSSMYGQGGPAGYALNTSDYPFSGTGYGSAPTGRTAQVVNGIAGQQGIIIITEYLS